MNQISIFFQSMFSTFLQSIHFNFLGKNVTERYLKSFVNKCNEIVNKEATISPKTERLINASQLEGELYFQVFDLKNTYIKKTDTAFRFITKETQRARSLMSLHLGVNDYDEAMKQKGFVLVAKNFNVLIKKTEDFTQTGDSFYAEDYYQSYSKDKIMIEFVGKTKKDVRNYLQGIMRGREHVLTTKQKEVEEFKDQIKGLELDLMATQDKLEETEKELNGSILDS